jgi:carbon-monoxide dehydrogenase small subunit
MSAKGLLDKNPDPTEDEIREGLSGNYCRCTGYTKIIDSVKHSANIIKENKNK